MDEDRQPAGARSIEAARRAAGRGGRRAPRALTTMVLHGLQSLLGRLYDVELNYDIYDFLVTDPVGALTETNLADYCTALEGVSHFVYSTWRLDRDLPVSLLELETQAEVDKYAVTVFLLADQQGGAYPAQVHARLFDRVSFDARLEPDQYHRYRTAHRCAAHYCRRLEHRFVSRGVARIEALVRELRKFYRLGSTAKLRHALA